MRVNFNSICCCELKNVPDLNYCCGRRRSTVSHAQLVYSRRSLQYSVAAPVLRVHEENQTPWSSANDLKDTFHVIGGEEEFLVCKRKLTKTIYQRERRPCQRLVQRTCRCTTQHGPVSTTQVPQMLEIRSISLSVVLLSRRPFVGQPPHSSHIDSGRPGRLLHSRN